MRSVVIDLTDYDWEGDQPLNRPMQRDDHLRDARRRLHQVADAPASTHPGTFAGVIEKIPYLKSLGVTAVELLPVLEFDEHEVAATNPIDGAAAEQLLGLQHRRLLRAARGLLRRARTRARRSASSATWSRRCTRPASR